jgi:hypothetical protein
MFALRTACRQPPAPEDDRREPQDPVMEAKASESYAMTFPGRAGLLSTPLWLWARATSRTPGEGTRTLPRRNAGRPSKAVEGPSSRREVGRPEPSAGEVRRPAPRAIVRPAPSAVRHGFSFLELQVALLLLAIALAGLGPLVVMQSRQLRSLESRFDDQTTYYLEPSEDDWARKLGAPAALRTDEPLLATPPVTLIDDGDPGYGEIDADPVDWQTAIADDAYQLDARVNDGGKSEEALLGKVLDLLNGGTNDGDVAYWEFTGLEPGWYEVLVTFPHQVDYAGDAPYTVYDDAAVEGTVRVSQAVAPSGEIFQGVPWESLGVFSIIGGTLRVELGDNAGGPIVADAVRIVPTGNVVRVVSVDKSLTGDAVTVQASVAVQAP